MKILFVHEVDYLKKVIFEMHEIPELLVARNHQVTFVDFPEHEKLWPPRFRYRTVRIHGRVQKSSEFDLVRMARVFPYPFDRIWNALSCWLPIRRLIRSTKPDLIVLYAVPTNGWQTLKTARALGIPVVYRAIDVSHEIRKSIFLSAVRIAERYVVRNASMTLANNDSMARHVIDLGAPPDHVRVLFPGVAGIDAPLQIHALPRRRDVLLFMGTLFDFCGVADLITWISTWGKAAKACELWILGGGGALSEIVLRAKENDFEIKLLGFVPFAELYEVMSQATVAVLPFDEISVAHKALPGKVPQYIVAGLPVVSTRLEGLQSLLPNEAGVLYAQPGEEFVGRIDELLNDVNLQNKVVAAGQECLKQRCCWPNVISEIELLLSQVVEDERPYK
jgi:hypothetical protein